MNDLISRQMAIDSIVAWTVQDRPDVEILIGRIRNLPPAQPSYILEQFHGLVDRQAVIDTIEGITSSMSVCVNSYECHGMKRMQRQAVLEILTMPSAQPVTIPSESSAVKVTNCNDTISRQDVIEFIHKTIYGFFDIASDDSEEPISDKDELLLEVNKAVCNGIKALPSAQTDLSEYSEKLWRAAYERGKKDAQQWVPCSERLPEKEGDYLCAVPINKKGDMDMEVLFWFGGEWNDNELSAKNNVAAWMPLPEAYQEGEKG